MKRDLEVRFRIFLIHPSYLQKKNNIDHISKREKRIFLFLNKPLAANVVVVWAAEGAGLGMGAWGKGAWLLGGEMERRLLVPSRGRRKVLSRDLRLLLLRWPECWETPRLTRIEVLTGSTSGTVVMLATSTASLSQSLSANECLPILIHSFI